MRTPERQPSRSSARLVGVLALVAALLWIAGVVLVVVGIRQLSPTIEGAYFTRDVGGHPVIRHAQRDTSAPRDARRPPTLLSVG